MTGRLITFGCSYTYGHGLPDCHVPPNQPGDNPSKYAWPYILGKKLKIPTINLSKCGASNREILYYIQNFSFSRSDIVVILWTYPMRDCIIDENGIAAQALPLDNFMKPWYLQRLKLGEFDYYHQMWTCMNYAKLFLDYLNLKNYHFTINLKYIKNPPKFNIVHIEDVDFLQIREIDLALDKVHPGKNAHKVAAKKFKEKINAYNK